MHRMSTFGAMLLAATTLALGGARIGAAQVRAGGEFRLNSTTGTIHVLPQVARDPHGGFVAVWLRSNGSGYGVVGRRFDRLGAPRGAEFAVSGATTGTLFPSLSGDGTGRFVVAWEDHGARSRILARRFDAAGAAGGEFVVDQGLPLNQTSPAVAVVAGGGFVVAWRGQNLDGAGFGIAGRRFDAAGMPLGAQFQVNTYTTGDQNRPSVAALADGGFAVTWASLAQESAADIYAQRFAADGSRAGDEFRVNAHTTGFQFNAQVMGAPEGGFSVVWTSQDVVQSLVGRRFSPAGAPLGAEFVVNTFTSYISSYFGGAALDGGGNLDVVWERGPFGGGLDVAGARFDTSGAQRGGTFQVNTYTTGYQILPQPTADDVGNFAVVWMSDQNETLGNYDIYAQRYGGLFPAALAVDVPGNGVLDPGETVDVRPSWLNLNGTAQAFSGSLADFSGPAGATYTVTDGSGSYGTVANGASQGCTDCYAVSVSNPAQRPAAHWDASAVERISPDTQGQRNRWTLHVGGSFTDVPSNDAFYRFVETLLHTGITTGCGPATFCPGASTTRAQMAVFLLTAREGTAFAPPACTTPLFNDVPASSPFCRWVEELARRAVTGGCGGGNYCPDAAVTREQMAVFLLRTLDPALNPPACTTPVFGDVPASSAFCRWVEELARRGITGGCGGGNYCPTQPVTREQMAAFLTTTFGLTLYGP